MASLVLECDDHRRIDGDELVRLRNKLGWSQEYLAGRVSAKTEKEFLCRTYITKLERPGFNRTSKDIAEALGEIFQNVTD